MRAIDPLVEPFRVSEDDQRRQDRARYQAFVGQSVRFLKSISQQHGEDVSHLVRDAVADILGRKWTSDMVMVMMSDSVTPSDNYTIVSCDTNIALIPQVRALRTVAGWGLRESKDAVDGLRAFGTTIVVPVRQDAPELTCDVPRTLREAGFVFHDY